MQHRHLFAESAAESVHCLWGQGYFRHQHYGGAALVQRLGDGLHVYLSLSAACNAVKEHGPLSPVHSCAYLFQYVSLRRRKGQRHRPGRYPSGIRVPICLPACLCYIALIYQRLYGGGRTGNEGTYIRRAHLRI